jgi:hypothetical protein
VVIILFPFPCHSGAPRCLPGGGHNDVERLGPAVLGCMLVALRSMRETVPWRLRWRGSSPVHPVRDVLLAGCTAFGWVGICWDMMCMVEGIVCLRVGGLEAGVLTEMQRMA